MSVIALQYVVALVSVPEHLHQMRYGDISIAQSVFVATAQCLIFAGGVLFYFGRRRAAFAFLASLAPALLAMLQWRPTYLLTGVVIALIAAWLSTRLRSREKTAG